MMKVGILGAGRIATKMAETLNAMDDAKLYAIASRDKDRAENFAKKYEIPQIYGSYQTMLEDKDIDLVYIATPHSHHFEHMKLCLEYGKHILCEKSFTMNAKQAREILALAKEKKLLVAEAIWTRYMPMRKTLDEILERKPVGEIYALTANLAYPVTHKQRVVDLALAGGALLDVGVYTINFAMMAFGHPLSVDGTCIKTKTGVDETNSISLVYEDGRLASLQSSISCTSDRRGLLFGTKGFIEFENINNCEGIKVYDSEYRLIEQYFPPKQISGFEYQVRACKRAIDQGLLECPEMPHSEIIKVMEVMDTLRAKWGIVYPGE